MTIWHIIEIILFIFLFIIARGHKEIMENLGDRISDLEDKTENLEGDNNNYDDDWKADEVMSRAYKDDNKKG